MLIPHAVFAGNGAALTKGSGTDSDALAWQAAVVAASGSVSASYLAAVSTYIAGLKADGIWSGLDYLIPYAAENATAASIDFVGRLAHTLNNSPTFTSLVGYQGDSTSSFINTNYNPASGSHWTQNDASLGAWIVTGDTNNSSRNYLGSHAGRNFFGKHSAGADWFCVNNPVSTDWTLGTEAGFFHTQRTASTTSALFRNGVSVQANGNSSAAVNSQNLYSLASNGNPGPGASNFSNGQLALVFAGASLTGAESAFFNRTHTFLNTINSGSFP